VRSSIIPGSAGAAIRTGVKCSVRPVSCVSASTRRLRAKGAEALARHLDGEIGARDFLRGRRITVDGEPATALQIVRDGRLEIDLGAQETRLIESGEVLFAR